MSKYIIHSFDNNVCELEVEQEKVIKAGIGYTFMIGWIVESVRAYCRQHLLTLDRVWTSHIEHIVRSDMLTPSMSNVTASRLGRVGLQFVNYPKEKIGDSIDAGLVLRRLLEESGFGIVMIASHAP